MYSYIIAKYALLGFHASLVSEFVNLGIRVNAVSPSTVQTSFLSEVPESYVEMVEDTLPQKKLAQPIDVARVVCFLASEKSAYINGANIPITGGSVI